MTIKHVILTFVFLFLSYLALSALFNEGAKKPSEITYSDFLQQAGTGKIHDVEISGHTVTGHYKENNREFTLYAPDDPGMALRLEAQRVEVSAAPPVHDSVGMTLLLNAIPLVLFLGVWFLLVRRNMPGGGGIGGFGKSKAKLLSQTSAGSVTFMDVAGVDDAKTDLTEIVDFLKDPKKFQRMGARIPRGVLLVGPPGTGKTLLARAIAGEANVPFFTTSGSDFVEMFVGVGASRMRDLFEQAKKNAPCIIFVDEIDAVGRHRSPGGVGSGGNDEREQTLNAFLVELDGFDNDTGVILVGATNRRDVLDPALVRPGRFDREIQVPNPDRVGRTAILKVHARKVPVGPDVDIDAVAGGTTGFSGADLANLVNEAVLLAVRRSKRIVTRLEFEDARDKILMGAERRSLLMTDEEKRLTAYHEGGHALVSLCVKGSTPIHKMTIVPRGRALGMVQTLPERDEVSQTKEQMLAMLAMAMGGRAAEELVFGEDMTTSGAASDIQMATQIARAMVTKLGFSAKLGQVAYEPLQQPQFAIDNHSEKTRETIDEEVKGLVADAYLKAKQILRSRRADLDRLAECVLKYETITGEEIKDVIAGGEIGRTA